MRANFLLAFLLFAVPATATAPDATTIVQRMKAALEPDRPSMRKLVIAVGGPEGEVIEWTAGQARKKVHGGNRMMTVILTPESLRGSAVLIYETAKLPDQEWVYIPVVRRVREIVPMQLYESFLNTDFTYADLGFVHRNVSYKLRGTEKREGNVLYELEEMTRDRWHYSRILTWVASDTWLPVRREFYDPANALWKVERFEQPTVIDGVATPLLIRMEDVQQRGTSEIRVSEVRYGVDVSDDLFEPGNLPQAADSSLWR
jgi:outer membrane lipoprotein-sorting protein